MEDLAHPLTPSLVRVLDSQKAIWGVGFLVAEGIVCTCAHVVAKALGIESDIEVSPLVEVPLDFPFLNGAQVSARVVAWVPIKDGGRGDIAVLQLTTDAPAGARPARLLAKPLPKSPFWTYGFPKFYGDAGQQAEGRLGNSRADGTVHLEGTQDPGFWLKPGYSGAPVWSSAGDGVVGMVVSADSSEPSVRVAFMIPVAELIQAWPALGPLAATAGASPRGSDAIRESLETRDFGHLFAGDVALLQQSYVYPASVFDDLGSDRFVGREWLTAKLDAFLNESDRGYFVLEAGDGLGKTAFLAHLVRQRGYVHYFVESSGGQAGVDRGLKSLTSQLIAAYGLIPEGVQAVLSPDPVPSDLLSTLLYRAVERRQSIAGGQPIVLVVDGLEHATIPSSNANNAFELPARLPAGVYFIVSKQPGYVKLDVQAPREIVELRADSIENLDDMRAYLRQVVMKDDVAGIVEGAGGTETFIETMLEKSQGLWIYLSLVIKDIVYRRRRVGDLNALPDGIWRYYARFFRDLSNQQGNEWSQLHVPLLAALAAAREDISLDLIRTFSGVDAQTGRLRNLLDVHWQPFLKRRSDPESGYGIYYSSLRDFLGGNLNRENSTVDERVLADELRAATQSAHGQIANYYLSNWGGLSTGLPGLSEAKHDDPVHGYGRRNLIAHLAQAGRADDIHDLLKVERSHLAHGSAAVNGASSYENVWFETQERAGDTSRFVSDVGHAWQVAAASSAEQFANGDRGSAMSLGLEARYILLIASINGIAQSIPPPLLLALVAHGTWSIPQGMFYARRTPDPQQRAETLLGLSILVSMPTAERDQAQREALAAARLVEAEHLASVLGRLAPHLSESLLREALALSETIVSSEWQALSRAVLIPRLAELGYPKEALSEALAIGPEPARGMALSTLVSYFDPASISLPIDAVRNLRRPEVRAKALLRLVDDATELPAQLRSQLVREAQGALVEIQASNFEGARALAELAPLLASLGSAMDARDLVRALPSPHERVPALASIVRYLDGPARRETLNEVLKATREFVRSIRARRVADPNTLTVVEITQYREERRSKLWPFRRRRMLSRIVLPRTSEALARIAPGLASAGEPRAALDAVRASGQGKALAALAPSLSERECSSLLMEAWSTLGLLELQDAFLGLVPRLAELGYPDEAFAWTQRLIESNGDAVDWRSVLGALAPHLLEPHLQQALELARGIHDAPANMVDVFQELADAPPPSYPAYPNMRNWSFERPLVVRMVARLAETGHAGLAMMMLRVMPNNEHRIRALVDVAQYLNQESMKDALAFARRLKDIDRWKGLAGIASYLPEALAQALFEEMQSAREESATSESSEWVWPETVLATLIPRLAELGYSERALAAARQLRTPWCWAAALSGTVPHLSDPFLQDTLTDVRESSDDWREREQVLGALAIRLGELDRLTEAVDIARAIQEDGLRAEVEYGLAPFLADLSAVDCYSFWSTMWTTLVSRSRPSIARDILACAPIINSLGGPVAVQETITAIDDVGRWWP